MGRAPLLRPAPSAAKLVRRLADQFGLPEAFTRDACRHGGMTELEEAELTTGQGKALSGHRTDRAYSGYAEDHDGARSGCQTASGTLIGLRTNRAHQFRMAGQNLIQNGDSGNNAAIA